MTDVRAQLRPATDAEVVEGLERNPGSRRLAEQGWTPLWFEVHTDEDDLFSLVWREPGQAVAELARTELDLALEVLGIFPDEVGTTSLVVDPDLG
jgi:hypothetical protein